MLHNQTATLVSWLCGSMLRNSYYAVSQSSVKQLCRLAKNLPDVSIWTKWIRLCLGEILSYLFPFCRRGNSLIYTTWDAQVGVEPEHPNLTYVLCEKHGKDVQWMHKFYWVFNPYPYFNTFFLLLWLKKHICMYFLLPSAFLCTPHVLKAPTKHIDFLY